ncbi:MAG TPA: SDR family oxidoreductase [Ramlibacter sp.]|nr:SDR family oxidoreductase [Ramlibacter sp.]
MKDLKDKIAVITGAGDGIGRSIALALADSGVHVVVADIQQGLAAAVAEEVRARGVRALAVQCDVSQLEAVTRLADQAYAEFGRVDILCNNAGVTWRPFRAVFDATLEDYQFVFGVNLWGVLFGLNAFLPRMKQQAGDKHIVNTASLAGLIPMAGHTAYSASKAAVVALTEAMAQELAPYGFGVTVFCPSRVPTNLQKNSALLTAEKLGTEPRNFAPVATPQAERNATFAMDSVEPVGRMVRNAILDNALFLHTNPLPSDIVADRIHVQYGSATVGKR